MCTDTCSLTTRNNTYKLTRCVSSSRGSLTARPVTALPLIARFLACWSDGEVELVDSTVT